MNPIVEKALQSITQRTNLSTGLTNSNDMNAAKEMFKRLHEAGEILLAKEIKSWAAQSGWQDEDANKLGVLAEQIGMGKKVRVSDGPWWKDDIIEQYREVT